MSSLFFEIHLFSYYSINFFDLINGSCWWYLTSDFTLIFVKHNKPTEEQQFQKKQKFIIFLRKKNKYIRHFWMLMWEKLIKNKGSSKQKAEKKKLQNFILFFFFVFNKLILVLAKSVSSALSHCIFSLNSSLWTIKKPFYRPSSLLIKK